MRSLRGVIRPVLGAAALLLSAAGCSSYDVPGADRPWPKLSEFPVSPDTAAMDKRRRQLMGWYGDPVSGLPQPRPEPADPPAGALQVAVIQFSRGGAELDDRAREVLAEVAAYAQQVRATVWLFGYASVHPELAAGGDPRAVGRALAAARATQVGAALVRQGVPPERLELVARGGVDPVYLEISATAETGNRRVEIHFAR